MKNSSKAFTSLGQIVADGIMNPDGTKKKDSLPAIAEKILESIISSANGYSYDMNSDALYRQYADMYKQQADFASRDIFGLASALTGGYANSYAMTAASKASEKAYSELNKKAEELEDKAYDRYLDEKKEKYSILDAVKLVDSLKSNETQNELDRAEFFAKYGDVSELRDLGVNTDSLTKKQLTDIAEVFAKYGDYSLLKVLGVDTSKRETEDMYNRLLLQAKYKKT